jgi:uncharacterized protein (DUF4415 family)
MKRYRIAPNKPLQLTASELERLDQMKDSDIDYSDIPKLGEEFFAKAVIPWPPPKQQLTIRLDVDVLAWLKASGRGYQTRINRILRTAMEITHSHGTPATTRPKTDIDPRKSGV